MERNYADMISTPAKFGFEWGYGELHKDGRRLTDRAPYIVHRDIELIRATFGDQYVIDSMNGTSARVRDQLLRNDLAADANLAKNDVAMKEIVLDRAFGNKTRRRSVTVVEKIVEKIVKVYTADDDTEFTDKLERDQYNMLLRAQDRITE